MMLNEFKPKISKENIYIILLVIWIVVALFFSITYVNRHLYFRFMPVKKETDTDIAENYKNNLFYSIGDGLFFCINGNTSRANGKMRNKDGQFDDIIVNLDNSEKIISITFPSDKSIVLSGECFLDENQNMKLKVISSDFFIKGETITLNKTKFSMFSDIYKNGYKKGEEWMYIGLNGINDSIEEPDQVKIPSELCCNWKCDNPVWVQNTETLSQNDVEKCAISLSEDSILYNEQKIDIGNVYHYNVDAKYVINYLGIMIFATEEINFSEIEHIEDMTEKVNLYFVYSNDNEKMFVFFNVDGCDSWWFVTEYGYMYKMSKK